MAIIFLITVTTSTTTTTINMKLKSKVGMAKDPVLQRRKQGSRILKPN